MLKQLSLVVASTILLCGCNSGSSSSTSPQPLIMAGTLNNSLNIITSLDNGATWASSLLSGVVSNYQFKTVTANDNVIVAGGGNIGQDISSNGTIYISNDGIHFNPITLTGTIGEITSIIYDGTKFIAATSDGAIYYSTDSTATTWVAAVVNPNRLSNITALAYGGGVYIAINNGLFSSSTDAINWSIPSQVGIAESVATNLTSIVYDSRNDLFLATDGSMPYIYATTPNQLLWNAEPAAPLTTIATDGKGNDVAMGESQVQPGAESDVYNVNGWYSTNGVNWESINEFPTESYATSAINLAYDATNELFVLIGSTNGMITIDTNSSISNWTDASINVSSLTSASVEFNDTPSAAIAFSNNNTYFVTGGTTSNATGNLIFSTTDYREYSNAISGFGINQMISTPTGLFAIGSNMLYNMTTPLLFAANTNESWSLINISGIDSAGNTSGFGGIAYKNGRYLLVRKTFSGGQSSDFFTSQNGSTWVTQTPSGFLHDAQYSVDRLIAANGTFVLLVNNQIFTSTDGDNWTLRATAANTLNDVIYANGSFIVVGDSGLMLQSTDTTEWTDISQPQYGALNLSQIIYANGQYNVLTNGNNVYGILVSNNAQTWAPANSSASPSLELNNLAFANNTYFGFSNPGFLQINSNVANLMFYPSTLVLNNQFTTTLADRFNFIAESQ